jgi:hypothetical protein
MQLPRSLAAQFLHRAITLALIAMVVPTTATAQPRGQSAWDDQRVDLFGATARRRARGGRVLMDVISRVLCSRTMSSAFDGRNARQRPTWRFWPSPSLN